MPGGIPNDYRVEEEEDFTFKNLQLVQHFEDKANEVAPVLEANIDILTEMREHYQSILRSEECPDEIKTGCQREFAEFKKRITRIVTDLQRQRSRTQILSRLLSDRKSLVRSHSFGPLNL
jgi:predicted RNase H-like nuclease (RuvC/YqgF family)